MRRRRRRGKKFDGGLTGLSTTFTPLKFDSVGPISRRNSTAPGYTPQKLYKTVMEVYLVGFEGNESVKDQN